MADIVIEDLTNGSLNADNEWVGTGIFDKLIAAVNKNIEGQYNLTRITGPEYATVYLGAMQSVIAQSMQYLLQEKVVEAQVDKLQEEIDLLRIQQIISDKEAAKLGLDDVIALSESARNGSFVYVPRYKQTT